jgi:hypothetical protein
MGIAMGLAFAFVLTLIDTIGVMALINHSADPKTAMLVFVGSFTLAFGVGATLTGFVFMMMEDLWSPLALDRKLAVIAETAATLADIIDTQRSLRLELIIAGLIAFEIAITFYQIFRPGH